MRNASKTTIECYDHLGNKYPSKTAMCEKYGVSLTLYIKRMQRHGDVKYALTGIQYDDPYNPEIGYTSASKMCDAYGIPLKIYKQRKGLGWSDEKALTTPIEKPNVRPVSHKVTVEGVEYPSIRAACSAHGVKIHTYYARIHSGWTMEEAITLPVSKANRFHAKHKQQETSAVDEEI